MEGCDVCTYIYIEKPMIIFSLFALAIAMNNNLKQSVIANGEGENESSAIIRERKDCNF